LPESIQVGSHYFSVSTITAFVALGVFLYLIIDRFLPSHHGVHEVHEDHADTARGNTGALTLVIHSLFDGIAIGLASFVPAALPIVAAAVLAHDFSDGINTVNLVFRNDSKSHYARLWLILDALAPIASSYHSSIYYSGSFCSSSIGGPIRFLYLYQFE
jgi:zinc transporter ZupT